MVYNRMSENVHDILEGHKFNLQREHRRQTLAKVKLRCVIFQSVTTIFNSKDIT